MITDTLDKQIYIYGTGQYAQVFLSYLQAKDMDDRITCFVVTKLAGDDWSFNGYPVYEFDQIEDEMAGKQVFIAISEEKGAGVREKLEQAGAGQIIQITEGMYDDLEEELFQHYTAFDIVDKQVIAWSFWGMGYADQCKYIAAKLHETDESIHIYWVVSGRFEFSFPEWITPVAIGTNDYYRILSTSRVLITNVNSPSADRFKRKGQYYIYTWHGIGPSKRLEWESPVHRKRDNDDRSLVQKRWGGADIMVAGSRFCHHVYRESFLYEGDIVDWGYPRNDVFFHENDFRLKVCKHFKIEDGKKIALYAPTFRNELMQNGGADRLREIYDIDLAGVRDDLNARFKQDFVLLYRFHYYVYRYVDISDYKQVGIDATYYPDMQELLVASDVLITDYSSSMWDFSLTRKPVFLYYHDAQEYEEKYQGFYVYPDEYPYPKGHTKKELSDAIRTFDDASYQKALDDWFERFGTFDDGHASERITERILDVVYHHENYSK